MRCFAAMRPITKALCIMNDYRLIKEFYRHFKGVLIDKNHTGYHHQLMIPAEPRVLHINSRAVACIDLNKPRGTVNGYVELYYLHVYPHQARKGFGKQIMHYLCELADKYTVEIHLEAIPLEGLGVVISKGDLRMFYQSFDFAPSSVSGSNLMIRKPNT